MRTATRRRILFVVALRQGFMNLLKRRATLEAVCDDPAIDPKSISPPTDRVCYAINSKKSSGSKVVGLFFCCCPPTVRRFVMAIVVNPVERSARWTRSHVAKELFKRFNPLWSNANSSTAPLGVTLTCPAQASIFHRCPRFVFMSMTLAMRSEFVSYFLSMKAPTGLSPSTIEFCRWHKSFIAALAFNSPFKYFPTINIRGLRTAPDNGKAAKSFAS